MTTKAGVVVADSVRAKTREGRYRILAQLGEGGMANVYLAVARGPNGFNKLVVLKALRPALANDSDFLQMFLNEARLAARLNHPNVVQTYEVGEDAGRHVIVMEYLDGESLYAIQMRARKTGHVLPLPMHLRILSDALAGLHHAHELVDFDGKKFELVHRDVSPQNVFITFDGQVKVLDFGIAKAVGSGGETSTGVIKGKVRYMAPEQIAGDRVDGRADIFAVGVMLWEALTGLKIWSGLADVVIMHKVINGEIPAPSSVSTNILPSLDRVCQKAMAFRRDNRYATARDFEKELDDCLAELKGDVKARAIGDFAASLFEDTRKERKVIIESQLSKAAALSADEFTAMTPILLPSSPAPSGSTSSDQIPIELEEMRPRATRKKWPFVLMIAGLLVMATCAYPLIHKARSSTASASTPKEEPAPAPELAAATVEPKPLAPPAAPETVDIKISASPPNAKLYLDDQQLPGNPYTASLPKDLASHKLRVEAPGYEARTQNVGGDRNADLTISLDRAHQSQPARPRPTGATAPTPAAPPPVTPASPSSPAKPNCSQPYFVDGSGIKRIRPDCL